MIAADRAVFAPMWTCQMASELVNSFALVAYVPGALGEFLDRLRQELVPGCSFRSHVTLLPPRPLPAEVQDAVDQIDRQLAEVSSFALELGDVAVFPATSVIYLNVRQGSDLLRGTHAMMNTGSLAYREPYPFHPHVTLAQGFPVEQLPELAELACRRWHEWRLTRAFSVEVLNFVQRTVDNNWINLVECWLRKNPA